MARPPLYRDTPDDVEDREAYHASQIFLDSYCLSKPLCLIVKQLILSGEGVEWLSKLPYILSTLIFHLSSYETVDFAPFKSIKYLDIALA